MMISNQTKLVKLIINDCHGNIYEPLSRRDYLFAYKTSVVTQAGINVLGFFFKVSNIVI